MGKFRAVLLLGASVVLIGIFSFLVLDRIRLQNEINIGDGGFLSGEPCGPPCFMGITPGVTKENDAIRFLTEKGLYVNCFEFNNERESGLRGVVCSNARISLTYFRGTDDVGSIGFHPSQQLTVDTVITKFGDPNAVSVSTIWPNSKPQPTTSLSLVYSDLGITLGLGERNGNHFDLAATTTIMGIGYSAQGFPSASEAELMNSYLSPWQGYGEYRNASQP